MINYFEAAEKTLRARGLLETALGNLERKKERILRYGAPSEYPSADMSKPYTGADEITEAVCYSSTSSLYDLRNKALVRFALLYFGAGAMPSM